ncbi:hypothetical protein MMC14_002311 [Varicellaria rhodocarpa]|nr:hypothetical protein [Varicellaria rhodocarpa]
MDFGERVTRSAKRRKFTVDDKDSINSSTVNKSTHTSHRSLRSAAVNPHDNGQSIIGTPPATFIDSICQSAPTLDGTNADIDSTGDDLSKEEELPIEHDRCGEDNEDNSTEDFIVVQQTPMKTKQRSSTLVDHGDRESPISEDNDLGKGNHCVSSDTVEDHQRSGTEDLHSVRSSGRQRKKSNKLLLALAETTKLRSSPTNTLTLKSGRPKRILGSTLSQKKEDSSQLHFDDIPIKPRSEIAAKIDRGILQSPKSSSGPYLQNSASSIPSKKRGRPPKLSGAVTPIKSTITPSNMVVSKTVEDESTSYVTRERLRSVLLETGSESQTALLQSQLMGALTGKRRMPLVGLEDEYEKVYQLVEQTVGAGEGNSMLVVGARGSAKTTLVEAVISKMKIDHQNDFHVVRLNGFIHTDDKLALKEIWRQLDHEMDVDHDTESAPTNYADTLASLLALLSHPAELSTVESSEDHTAKSVVFIIDEFDLFANHSRQTLLYNLFDISQSRKAPIAVLGLTTKIDIVESLEKRVKSRFSHRYVHLSLPKSFSAFRDICKAVLTYQPHIPSLESSASLSNALQHFDILSQRLQDTWNAYISSLLDSDPILDYLLRQIYAHTKSVSSFFATCFLPVLSLTSTSIPSGVDFISNALRPPDSKLSILAGLSDLELSLLISAARLDIVLDTDTCNFNMAYDEYTSLAEKAKLVSSASGAAALGGGAKIWGRDIAMGAWERLEALELLIPALGAGGGAGVTDIGRAGKLWKVDVGLEEIGMSGVDMSAVMSKWCREI